MNAECTDLGQVPTCLAVGWLQDFPDAVTFGPDLFRDEGPYPGCCNDSSLGSSEEQMKDWGCSVA